MIKGFSTGALAKNDFKQAIELLRESSATAIELSALREDEVKDLVYSIDDLDLSRFEYVSFHAPGKLIHMSEDELITLLEPVIRKEWPIITHPDIITNFNVWKKLGNCLCIENMDKRKPIGRTTIDLDMIFNKLPTASFCFDIAHARQVDPTMTEGYLMVNRFKDKLKEIHISSVNTQSKHEPLTLEALLSFKKLAGFIPGNIPIILESPVTADQIEREMDLATSILLQEDFGQPSYQKLKTVLDFVNTN
jgi:hypothetical protein